MRTRESMWMVHGSKPVLWTIPYYIVEHEGVRERDMFSAIPLLAGQKKAADAVIIQVGRPFNGAWKITLEELETIAYPTEGGEPEQYFSWQRSSASASESNQRKERCLDMNEFIDAVYQTGIGNSRGEVASWWDIFCNLGLDWMLNKNRALDLGFVKLHPSPYRRDWQRTVIHKIWNCVHVLKKFYAPKGAKKIWSEMILDRFKNPSMWAFDGKICRRYVDVEHKKGWVENMVAVETARQKQMGRDYIGYVQASVQRRLKTSIRLFRLFALDSLHPRAKTVKRHPRGDIEYVAASSVPGSVYEWINLGRTHWAVPAIFEYRGWRKSRHFPQKDGDMPGLPSLRQKTKDLRNAGDDVSGSDDEEI